MRLWSLHPCYLDAQGLVALWREALLAQAVLQGKTKGYRHHPQLRRFQASPEPVASIAHYLRAVATEAQQRGYRFAMDKIAHRPPVTTLSVTEGQCDYEWQHLCTKLQQRSPTTYVRWANLDWPQLHPLFHATPGPVEPWEIAATRR